MHNVKAGKKWNDIEDDPHLLTAVDATGPLFTLRLASTRGLKIEAQK
jgi:hypothetical protein